MYLFYDHPFRPPESDPIRSYPSLDIDLECEVVVIGAGITGALCAYHLTKAGMDVAVLEKGAITGGGSASKAALHYELDTPLSELIGRMGKPDAERAYQVCLESIGKIAELCDEIGDPCGFTWKSSVYLASRKKDVPGLRAEYAARLAAGIELDFLSQADVEGRFSFSRPAALVSKIAAEVNVYQLTHRLLQRIQEKGTRIFGRTEMESYEVNLKGVTVNTAEGATVRARWVVFATGYEDMETPHKLVTPKSSFAFVTEPIRSFPGWWEKCLLWETARPYLHMRTTADGRAIIGGADASYRDSARRDAALGKKAAKLEQQFLGMFPDIDMQPAHAWAVTYGETKDGLAYIDNVPECRHCFFTMGFGRNGIPYSVIAAEIIGDAILGKTHPDAHLFRFDR
jgi:glycine/D-amino acid oxidase-like deaminating enzyme